MAGEQWISGFAWHQQNMVTKILAQSYDFYPHLAELDNLDFTLSPNGAIQNFAFDAPGSLREAVRPGPQKIKPKSPKLP